MEVTQAQPAAVVELTPAVVAAVAEADTPEAGAVRPVEVEAHRPEVAAEAAEVFADKHIR